MTRIIHGRWKFAVLICIALSISSSLMAQQHGQYQPGQYGLNAGIMPDPGFTYGDYNLNFNAHQLNLENGTPVKTTGTYNVWAWRTSSFMFPSSRFSERSSRRLSLFPR